MQTAFAIFLVGALGFAVFVMVTDKPPPPSGAGVSDTTSHSQKNSCLLC